MIPDEQLYRILKSGDIAVLRTDTLYGIVAQATNERAVARVFDVKRRDLDKPLIVLIASPQDAWDGQDILAEYSNSTRPTSVIVDSPHAPAWLRHHDGTVAYRVPVVSALRNLLAKTGPLVAPSANPQGLPPANTATMAEEYFGDMVKYYADGGIVPDTGAPSRIIRVTTSGERIVIRD